MLKPGDHGLPPPKTWDPNILLAILIPISKYEACRQVVNTSKKLSIDVDVCRQMCLLYIKVELRKQAFTSSRIRKQL